MKVQNVVLDVACLLQHLEYWVDPCTVSRKSHANSIAYVAISVRLNNLKEGLPTELVKCFVRGGTAAMVCCLKPCIRILSSLGLDI